ncbi:alkaline phosphatase family protein [Undibacterium sp. Di24W]|uniref:alkaline phosphatase family protein n=1 Tax=Undibacterium sp. Di24W TaxID=3413033 RepID=UPI003BF373FD
MTSFSLKRRLLLSSIAAAFSCSFIASASLAAETPKSDSLAAPSKPKLVVVLVVDGLPQEQIQRYRDQFGEGGFKRLLTQGAWYSDAHQAHGVTLTAVGHSAVLTGAYPYQHGIIANGWVDTTTLANVYCTEDANHTYLGEDTKPGDGTSPANLKVNTVGDELRYATGNQSKVIAISGKDRGAILLAGKTGTAYMMMKKTGNFATSTYYMKDYPAWREQYVASKPQDKYYGQRWNLLLDEKAYANDVNDDVVIPGAKRANDRLPIIYSSQSGTPDAEYYESLFTGPYMDEMSLAFAQAAVEGEKLGSNPAGVPDVLGISLSSHDYVNHRWGPESRMSHDHLQRLDRMLAKFFTYIDKKVGMDNTLVLLTADHGFPNTPEFARVNHLDAARIESGKMMTALNQHLQEKFGLDKLAKKFSSPTVLLDYKKFESKGLKREELENAVAEFAIKYPGIADAFTRTQFENGNLPNSRIAKLMQRAWNRQVSGDVALVVKPYWYFGNDDRGTSHGSPYRYDTNVPLMIMGKKWIKPGAYGQEAEVVDIAPTLAHILRVRPPAGSEGRVLVEALK